MIIIKSSHMLTAELAAQTTTTALTFAAAYFDIVGTSQTPVEDVNIGTLGTSPIEIMPTPALGTIRHLSGFHCVMLDSVPATIIIKLDAIPVCVITLSIGDILDYERTAGRFTLLSSSGAIKETSVAAWGAITGTLSTQTDLSSALAGKVPSSRTIAGHALSADVTLTAADVGADAAGSAAAITLAGLGGVPTSRTVAGHALTGNVTITAADVGADASGAAAAITLAGLGGVPTSRTVAGHALTANVTITAADVGADVSGAAAAITLAGLGGIATSQKGVASGVASLDGTTKVPYAQLPTGTSASTVLPGNDASVTNSRVPAAHASSHVTGGSDVIANVVAAGNAGLMTGSDKTKLDGVAVGATALSLSSTTPTAESSGLAGAVGTGTTAARSDHAHGMPNLLALAGTTPSTLTSGGAAVVGTDAGASHADHVHAMPTLAVLAATTPTASTYGGTAAVGTDSGASHADHKHALAALPTASTSAAGIIQIASASPAAESYGATAVSGSTGNASDAGHVHALPALPISSTSAAGIIQLGSTVAAEAFGATAVAGSSGLASDRDHVHAMPAAPTASSVGLGNVTNDAQTKAAVVPNTAPASGQLPIGNAGGTAYAPVTVTGDVTITNAGVTAIKASPTLTTPTISGLLTPATVAGIKGTAAADSAQAGSVGEVITATVVTGSSISLTTVTSANVTSIALTAGDWDVWGCVCFTLASSTTMGYLSGGINTTSATLPLNNAGVVTRAGAGTNATIDVTVDSVLTIMPIRINVSSSTTTYLVARAKFGTSTCKAYGTIYARRHR